MEKPPAPPHKPLYNELSPFEPVHIVYKRIIQQFETSVGDGIRLVKVGKMGGHGKQKDDRVPKNEMIATKMEPPTDPADQDSNDGERETVYFICKDNRKPPDMPEEEFEPCQFRLKLAIDRKNNTAAYATLSCFPTHEPHRHYYTYQRQTLSSITRELYSCKGKRRRKTRHGVTSPPMSPPLSPLMSPPTSPIYTPTNPASFAPAVSPPSEQPEITMGVPTAIHIQAEAVPAQPRQEMLSPSGCLESLNAIAFSPPQSVSSETIFSDDVNSGWSVVSDIASPDPTSESEIMTIPPLNSQTRVHCVRPGMHSGAHVLSPIRTHY
ncbi:hypothetical protein J8273_7304 [Carpediemonas membranifera]|uniref:Uncharacterized protein n=1 Tax=Carpediemonas membranifera TaxID=201153 RepID=A0A8J6E7S7_9EUKA|nr:hypothetical protein J8273_7304 [Carpediemonas membranifera]|eukprot:KAG9391030.1 hypothetical protein J8273_7304 [Carpediemonas membranifera]